ncbi:hypothetical protein [Pseudoduganella sp. GCM10020061]|uniref:hypothetical protein n=1 Tax=Pseudoduganella sp. GCM10020061 TaxID=3317345 RepID=UPI003641E486
MDSNDDKRQALIAQATAGSAYGQAMDGPVVQPWRQLSAHLSPLIGDSGFAALYRRTVRIESVRFDWLDASHASSTADELLQALKDQLAAVGPGQAEEANTALLITFTKLLSGLIGEALTVRLLNAAWSGAPENAKVREQS